jgi:hypothetical protein
MHGWDLVRRILQKTEVEKFLGMLPLGRTMVIALQKWTWKRSL